MIKYIFDSSGGCARCENMDGEYDEKPTRPHPYCDCEIYATETETECYRMRNYKILAVATHIDDQPDVMELLIEVVVGFDLICLSDNSEHSEEFEYEKTVTISRKDDEQIFDLIDEYAAECLDKFKQESESIADDICDCGDEDQGGINFS